MTRLCNKIEKTIYLPAIVPRRPMFTRQNGQFIKNRKRRITCCPINTGKTPGLWVPRRSGRILDAELTRNQEPNSLREEILDFACARFSSMQSRRDVQPHSPLPISTCQSTAASNASHSSASGYAPLSPFQPKTSWTSIWT